MESSTISMHDKGDFMATNSMMDAALESIEKRQARLEEVEAERDQLVKEIDSLQLSVAVIQKDYGYELCVTEWPVYPYSDLHYVEDADIPITHKARNAAYVVLAENGWMHRNKLLEGIEAQGVEIVGRNPVDLLSSYLSPDARFMPVPGLRGYWTLTQEPTSKRPMEPDSEG